MLEKQAKKDSDLAKMLEGLVVTPEKFGEVCSKANFSYLDISARQLV